MGFPPDAASGGHVLSIHTHMYMHSNVMAAYCQKTYTYIQDKIKCIVWMQAFIDSLYNDSTNQ